MTYEEVALLLDVSAFTVRRAWDAAHAWLRHELADGMPDWSGSRLAPSEADA